MSRLEKRKRSVEIEHMPLSELIREHNRLICSMVRDDPSKATALRFTEVLSALQFIQSTQTCAKRLMRELPA